ncbi:hypothetical protein [Actinacidiphila sp. bgisy144]|uniref:hypothetical protein n=1 Tax=Actinacidiphila sp. bgisy144 TaxID=3413791 RepID=UPI003EBB1DE6
MNRRLASAAVVLGSAAALLSTAGASYAATGAPAAQPAASSVTWQPCAEPSGYDHFFELRSATVHHGKVTVRVTPETCRVNKHDDEDVDYTATGAARTLVVPASASVKVLKDTTSPHKVTPRWLVTHDLDHAHFFYRLDARHQVGAMEQIYHP